MPSYNSSKKDHARVIARIKRVQKWHEERYHDKWQRFVNLYACRHYPDVIDDQERIAVNITFAIVNVIVPAVSHNYPKITVTPLKKEYEMSSKLAQLVVNSAWQNLDVQGEVREALKDAVITGTGVVKVGYRRTTEDVARSKRAIADEFDDALAQRDAAAQEAYESGEGNPEDFPSDEDVFLSIPTTERAVTNDDIFVERCKPEDVFVDPDATDEKDLGFVIQRVYLPLDRVKNNKLYRKSVRDKIAATTKSAAYAHTGTVDGVRDDYERDTMRVCLYEVWDVHDKTFTVYADGCDEPLRGPEAWPYRELPFKFFRNNTVPNEFWAMGEVEAIESQQRELNKTRSQMLNQRRNYNRKVLFRNGVIGRDALDELKSDRDGVFVPVSGNIALNEAFHILQPPPLDAQLYQFEDTIKGDITEVSSVSEYQRGQLPDIRRTATEASLIESASSVRAQDKLSRVEKFMADIARCMLALMHEFYTETRATRVLGADNVPVWFEYNGDFIFGEYDVHVEAGSTQPTNEAMAKQDALTLFSTVAQHPMVNQGELLKHVFETFNVDPRKFIQAPPPMLPEQAETVSASGASPAEGETGATVVGPEGEDANPQGGDLAALMAQLSGQLPVPGVSA